MRSAPGRKNPDEFSTQAPDEVPEGAKRGSGSSPRCRILLAEDNEDARRAFSVRLGQMGLEVATARDGQDACDQALAALREGFPFHWILMDMQMPVVDGFEATRQLRSQGYDGPIIAMTAYATEHDRQECIRFGCDDHTSKPIDWEVLAALLAANRS
jgi:two-component system, sensor histidine kinase